MKHFLDCEFIEGIHVPLFGKRRHYIDLISIGIVCEDGQEYYAISSDYSFKRANQWVIDNVIAPIYMKEVHGDQRNNLGVDTFHKAIGKPNKQIAAEVKAFLMRPYYDTGLTDFLPELYGYYADYDHVLLCSLFGTMMDLPKGLPLYTRDLKQMVDDWVLRSLPILRDNDKKWYSFDEVLETLKSHANYPKQSDEHNALADARWNYELYKFITS